MFMPNLKSQIPQRTSNLKSSNYKSQIKSQIFLAWTENEHETFIVKIVRSFSA